MLADAEQPLRISVRDLRSQRGWHATRARGASAHTEAARAAATGQIVGVAVGVAIPPLQSPQLTTRQREGRPAVGLARA